MVIHDFDNETEPLIKLENFYGSPKQLVDKCLIIFSKEIHDHLLAAYTCEQIGLITGCNGNTPIYRMPFGDGAIAFYLTGIGSTIASGTCYEVHWQTGATKFIMFGSCGSLDREQTSGRYIVPSACYRGDGCSYYYAPPSDYLTVKNSGKVAAVFDELGVPYVQAKVWTTDSMLRETVGLVHKRKAEGCIAVEMELAGVEAMCEYYGLELYDFLEAGDVLEENAYDTQDLYKANHHLEKLRIALEIADRI